MSIILSLLLGTVVGAMLGAAWRVEELEKLTKDNARLIEERANAVREAQQVWRTQQKFSVN